MQDILYLTAMLNTCINPLIYGVYYFSERSGPEEQRTRNEYVFIYLYILYIISIYFRVHKLTFRSVSGRSLSYSVQPSRSRELGEQS